MSDDFLMDEERECLRCGTLLGSEDEGICPTCGAVFGRETIAMAAIPRSARKSTPGVPARAESEALDKVLEGVADAPPSAESYMPPPVAPKSAEGGSAKLLWVLAGFIGLLAVILIAITIFIVSG